MSGKGEEYYLIGFISEGKPGATNSWGGSVIAFRANDQHIAVSHFPVPHAAGSVQSIADWLRFQPGEIVQRDGRTTVVREPPGWFERTCHEANAGWFLSFARRIATGEKVPLPEIEQAYGRANEGRAMPHGSIDALFSHRPVVS